MTIDRPIAIALILFVVLVLGFYFVSPKYQEFKEIQLKVSEKEAEFKGKAEYFAEVSKTFKKLKDYEENLGKIEDEEHLGPIEDALPSTPSLAPLIYFFQIKSSENGLIFRRANLLSISLVNERSDIKEITFSLEFFGSYPAFKNFLISLEKSARLIEVESISFISQQESGQTYPFNLTIKVYSY